VPEKGWNVMLRLCRPLEPWFDQTWRPREIERVGGGSFRAALALAVVTSLAACAVNPVSGKPELALISPARERQLGREEAGKIEEAMGFVANPRLATYVSEVGARVAAQSPLRGVDYTFHVVDIPEPNAFALPGGYVYVTRGLVVLMSSEDELAGVVAHEVAHVAARHAVQRVSRAVPMGILSGIGAAVTGIVSPTLGDLVGGMGSLATQMLLAPYGREQEREADRVGARMVAEAGWSPAALADALHALEREEALTRKGRSDAPSFLATHPSLPERTRTVRAVAATLSVAPRRPVAATALAFLEPLDGLVVGKGAADGVFQGRSFVHPDLDVAIAFPPGWKTQNTREAVGAVAPDGRATIALEVAGTGEDPMQSLVALDEASGTDLARRAQRTTIGGRPAAHIAIQVRTEHEPLALDLTCVAHRGRIFRILGATRPASAQEFASAFEATARGLRAPSSAELSRIRETRLRLVRGRHGETLKALVVRMRSVWRPEMVAVANGLADSARLEAGQLVKIAVSEPYVARR
jgi:predicted Zn-dependent protease